jgi:hypothetical protein
MTTLFYMPIQKVFIEFQNIEYQVGNVFSLAEFVLETL